MKVHFQYLVRPAILLFLFSLANLSCQPSQYTASETLLNQEIISEEGEPILVGALNRKAWQKTAYKDWFAMEFEAYQVKETVLSEIMRPAASLEILVFLGTWCSDSQREVPRLYKILDYLEFDEHRLSMIALDNHTHRYKQSPQHEEVGWDIEFVPTIIFLRNGVEIGRITEMPEASLEADLAAILRRNEA